MFDQDLPDNGASIAVLAGPASSEQVRSIDEWIALRERAHPGLVRRSIRFAAPTRISNATEVEWSDAADVDGGDTVTRTVAVFFLFGGTPHAAILDHKDRAGFDGEFRAGLKAVLNSFRPVTTGNGCRP